MKKLDLDRWYKLNKLVELTHEEVRELVRINHLVMEVCHNIHNLDMLGFIERNRSSKEGRA